MKKTILLFALATMFAACSSNSTETTTTDSIAVDTAAVVDSTAVTAVDSTTSKIVEEVTEGQAARSVLAAYDSVDLIKALRAKN